jgi:hypothetical protein
MLILLVVVALVYVLQNRSPARHIAEAFTLRLTHGSARGILEYRPEAILDCLHQKLIHLKFFLLLGDGYGAKSKGAL